MKPCAVGRVFCLLFLCLFFYQANATSVTLRLNPECPNSAQLYNFSGSFPITVVIAGQDNLPYKFVVEAHQLTPPANAYNLNLPGGKNYHLVSATDAGNVAAQPSELNGSVILPAGDINLGLHTSDLSGCDIFFSEESSLYSETFWVCVDDEGNQTYLGKGHKIHAYKNGRYFTMSALILFPHQCRSVSNELNNELTGVIPDAAAVTVAGNTLLTCVNTSATISVNGTYNYYRWLLDNQIIAGANTNSYSATNAGRYTAEISNDGICWSGPSNPIDIGVQTPPTPYLQTSSPAIAFCGTTYTLTAGGASLYQWYKNGVAIPGATSSTYQAASEGSYTVAGSVDGTCYSGQTSAAIQVDFVSTERAIINYAPGTSLPVNCGSNVMLETEPEHASYRWYKDNVLLSGENNYQLTVAATGTYAVEYNDDLINECYSERGELQVIFALPTSGLNIQSSVTLPASCGQTVTLTSSNTTYTYYKWFRDGVELTTQTNSSITVTEKGIYTLIVANNPSCYSLPTIRNVSFSNNLSAPSISPNPAYSNCDQQTTLTATGNFAKYLWYKSGVFVAETNTNTYSTNVGGSYSVKGSDATGCETGFSASVTINKTYYISPYALESSYINYTINSGNNVLRLMNAPDMTGYTFQWQEKINGFGGWTNIPGATSPEYSFQRSGIYRLQYSLSSCIGYSTETVVNIGNVNMVLIFPGSNQVVMCRATAKLTATPGYQNYIWKKNNIELTTTTVPELDISSHGNGTYSVSALGIDNYGVYYSLPNSNNNTVTLKDDITPQVMATPGNAEISCDGGSVQLRIQPNTGAYQTYEWKDPSGTVIGTSLATATVPGTYTFKVTDAAGCSGETTIDVTANSAAPSFIPQIAMDGGGTLMCRNTMKTLRITNVSGIPSNNGYLVQWYKDGNLFFVSYNNVFTTDINGPGVYQVRIIASNAVVPFCAAPSNELTIDFYPEMTVSVASDNYTPDGNAITMCSNSPAHLVATTNGSFNLQWQRADLNSGGYNYFNLSGQTQSDYTVNMEGFYRVNATDANGCTKISNYLAVHRRPAPPAVLAYYTFNNPNATVAPASLTYCGNQPSGGLIANPRNLTSDHFQRIQWYKDGVAISGDAGFQLAYVPVQMGTYYFTAEINNCFTQSASISITTKPFPTSTFTIGQPRCSNEPITFTYTGTADPAAIYYWTFDNATSSNGSGAGPYNVSYTNRPGNKNTKLKVVDPNGCFSETPLSISVASPPAVNLSSNKNNVCAGEQVLLIVGASDFDHVEWYEGATLIGTTIALSTPVTPTVTTVYTAKVFNPWGCSTSRNITITIKPVPAAPVIPVFTSACANNPVTITVANATSGLTYQWFDQNNQQLSSTTSTITVSDLSVTGLTVTARGSNGCTSLSTATGINRIHLPTPDNKIYNVCGINAVYMNASSSVAGPQYNYRWYNSMSDAQPFFTGSTYIYTAPDVTENTSVKYYVSLIMVDNNYNILCESDRAMVHVNVYPTPQVTITPSSSPVCKNQMLFLHGEAPGATQFKWYDLMTGNQLHDGQDYMVNIFVPTTFRLVAEQNGCYGQAITTVDVHPLAVDPVLDPEVNICAGESSTLHVNNILPGYQYQWFDPFGSLVKIGDGTLVIGPTGQAGAYTVRSVSDVGCQGMGSGNTTVTRIHIYPPVVPNTQTCNTSMHDLSVQDPQAGFEYRWYDSPTGNNLLFAGDTYSRTLSNAITSTQVFTYYVSAALLDAQGNVVCESIRTQATATMHGPETISVSPETQPICGGETYTVTLLNRKSYLQYSWPDGSSGDTYVFNPNAVPHATLWATHNVTGCWYSARFGAVYVGVPQPADVDPLTVCQGTSATLSVTNVQASATYHWYDAANNLLGSGSVFTTPVVEQNTTFYVETKTSQQTTTCSSQKVAVNVYVTSNPALNLGADVSVCAGSSTVLGQNITPQSGIDYQWTSIPAGFTSSSPTLTVQPSAATTFILTATNTANSCVRTEDIQVTVNPMPPVPIVIFGPEISMANPVVCEYAEVGFGVSTPLYNVYDYGRNDPPNYVVIPQGGSSLGHGGKIRMKASGELSFYTRDRITGCESRVAKYITVNPAPVNLAHIVRDEAICQPGTVTMQMGGATASQNYRWYNTGANTVINTGATYTPILNVSKSYSVSVFDVNTGCENPERTEVAAFVSSYLLVPVAPQNIYPNTPICQGASIVMKAFPIGGVGANGCINLKEGKAQARANRSVENAFTIEFWMKTTQTGPSGTDWEQGYMIVDASVSGVNNDYGFSLLGNKVAFGVGNPNRTIISTKIVNDGAWHHVAATRSILSGEIILYVDGKRQNAANIFGNKVALNASSYMYVGGRTTGVQNYNGSIDELRTWTGNRYSGDNTFYSTAISLPSDYPSLISVYRFDQGGGTSVLDKKGTNHFTLEPNVTFSFPSVTFTPLVLWNTSLGGLVQSGLDYSVQVNQSMNIIARAYNNSSCSGAYAYAVTPINCAALYFDATNRYVTIPRSNTYSNLAVDGFTYEAVIRMDPSSGYGNILSMNGSGSSYSSFMNVTEDGRSIIAGAGWLWATSDVFPFTLRDGNCHHIAVTKSKTVYKASTWWPFDDDNYSTCVMIFYVDGVIRGTRVIKTSGNATASGNAGAGVIGGRYLKGYINEVRVWNTVRTTNQIRSNINVNIAVNSSGLIGFWNFKDNNTNTQEVKDLSGTKNHATLGSSNVFEITDPIRSNLTCFSGDNIAFEPEPEPKPEFQQTEASELLSREVQQVYVYPNPSESEITLLIESVDESVQVELYNMMGEKVATYENVPTNQEYRINPDLISGTYLLRVYGANTSLLTQIVRIK